MLDWLEGIDRWIVLTVNGWNTPLLDELMWYLSEKGTWVPLYVLLLWMCWKQLGTRKMLVFVGIVALTIAVVDISSVYLFKEMFQRYRPSHHAWLTNKLHFYAMHKERLPGLSDLLARFTSGLVLLIGAVTLFFQTRYPKLLWAGIAACLVLVVLRIYFGVYDSAGFYGREFYKGGQFGFVSSHATNFFAVTVLVGMTLRQRYPKLIWVLLGISIVVCFSRLYLGVHYLSDLVCGALWGSLLAWLSYRFLVKRFLLISNEEATQ